MPKLQNYNGTNQLVNIPSDVRTSLNPIVEDYPNGMVSQKSTIVLPPACTPKREASSSPQKKKKDECYREV